MPAVICIFLLVLLLCFPELCVRGASDGLALWLFTLVPTFFPFLTLSNYMVACGAATDVSRLCGRILCPLFRVSPAGAYILFMGFLCGYPMGAKLTADFVKTQRITPDEGSFLLTFCNNPSPMFLVGFVLPKCMKEPFSHAGTLVMFYAAPVLTGLLLARTPFCPGQKKKTADSPQGKQSASFSGQIRSSMSDAFSTLLYLGGYVILFQIISALIRSMSACFPEQIAPLFSIPAAFLEMTGGVLSLSSAGFSAELTNLCVPLCVIFGGVCILAQTAGFLTGSGLSVRPFLRGKMLQMALFTLFCLLLRAF